MGRRYHEAGGDGHLRWTPHGTVISPLVSASLTPPPRGCIPWLLHFVSTYEEQESNPTPRATAGKSDLSAEAEGTQAPRR
jgi:hypothetical protein